MNQGNFINSENFSNLENEFLAPEIINQTNKIENFEKCEIYSLGKIFSQMNNLSLISKS